MFITPLFIIAKLCNEPNCSSTRLHKVITVYCTNDGTLLSHIKNVIVSFIAKWIQLQTIMLNKIRLCQTDKYVFLFASRYYTMYQKGKKKNQECVGIKVTLYDSVPLHSSCLELGAVLASDHMGSEQSGRHVLSLRFPFSLCYCLLNPQINLF